MHAASKVHPSATYTGISPPPHPNHPATLTPTQPHTCSSCLRCATAARRVSAWLPSATASAATVAASLFSAACLQSRHDAAHVPRCKHFIIIFRLPAQAIQHCTNCSTPQLDDLAAWTECTDTSSQPIVQTTDRQPTRDVNRPSMCANAYIQFMTHVSALGDKQTYTPCFVCARLQGFALHQDLQLRNLLTQGLAFFTQRCG